MAAKGLKMELTSIGIIETKGLAALVCATAIGVAVGGALFRVVPPAAIKYASGLAFIAVGVWVLARG